MSDGIEGTEAHRNYERPPITEAVIEMQFATELGFETVNRIKEIFLSDFPRLKTISITTLVPTESSPPTIMHSTAGFRMDTADSTEIISFTTGAFAFSRLAPYNGWDAFSAQALEAYSKLRDKLGYVSLKRVGVRFINRLDIPLSPSSARLRLEDYLTILPQYPEDKLSALRAFTMQTIYLLQGSGCQVTINLASVPSPVPARTSVILDIDAGRTEQVPQSRDGIRNLLDTIRRDKNHVFEACITDATRELFD